VRCLACAWVEVFDWLGLALAAFLTKIGVKFPRNCNFLRIGCISLRFDKVVRLIERFPCM